MELYKNNPVAGVPIASRSVVVNRGGKNPRRVDLSSKIDDPSGVIDISLIPTPCEYDNPYGSMNEKMMNKKRLLFFHSDGGSDFFVIEFMDIAFMVFLLA